MKSFFARMVAADSCLRLGFGGMQLSAVDAAPASETIGRITFKKVDGIDKLFTPEFVTYLEQVFDKINPLIQDARLRRTAVHEIVIRELAAGRTIESIMEELFPDEPMPLGGYRGEGNPVPAELKKPGIIITGPDCDAKMVINAVNGQEVKDAAGQTTGYIRAVGWMPDAEDSSWPGLWQIVQGKLNRMGVVLRTLVFNDGKKDRKINGGPLPFIIHREPGIHLDAHEVSIEVNGKQIAVPLSILGTALTLFHVAPEQAARGETINFYLPKLETGAEAGIFKEFYDLSRKLIPGLATASINAIPLIESLPAVYQMGAMLKALGEYGAGLNAARWDLKASILEYILSDPLYVWPDRFFVDLKKTKFIENMYRRLVAICLKGGYIPDGGMATALPHKNDTVNEKAAASIRADKRWEAARYFIHGWVAHIFHIDTAQKPFQEHAANGLIPNIDDMDADRYPIKVEQPVIETENQITEKGTRRNLVMLLEYLEGWMAQRGAKGINSLAGTEEGETTPALMEDLATGRISVAQTAQRIIHGVTAEDTGTVHTQQLVFDWLNEEFDKIVARGVDDEALKRYQGALQLAMIWIHHYCELDFRALGTYSYDQLIPLMRPIETISGPSPQIVNIGPVTRRSVEVTIVGRHDSSPNVREPIDVEVDPDTKEDA